jgi:hypothetical protein
MRPVHGKFSWKILDKPIAAMVLRVAPIIVDASHGMATMPPALSRQAATPQRTGAKIVMRQTTPLFATFLFANCMLKIVLPLSLMRRCGRLPSPIMNFVRRS